MRNFGYSPMYYHSSFWPEGVIALIINILIWGLVIYLVMHIVRKMSGGHGCCGMHGEHNQSEKIDDSIYLDIVKRRYAKGEINKKEYEELKKDFSGDVSEAIETAKE